MIIDCSLKGARIKISAHFLSSIWSTGSPRPFQESHSSWSRWILSTFSSWSFGGKKCKALWVGTRIISTLSIFFLSSSVITLALMVATLPVTPKRMFLELEKKNYVGFILKIAKIRSIPTCMDNWHFYSHFKSFL